MKGIKRSVRTRGKVLGHNFGDESLAYREARERIYIPTYTFVLEHRLKDELDELRTHAEVVLLDYETNGDIDDLSKPLSHASLVAKWLWRPVLTSATSDCQPLVSSRNRRPRLASS